MFYDEYIKLCSQIGRSPSAVAESLGFQKSAVTRWKQGSTPTDNNKRKIAEFFGVPVSTFLTPTPVPSSPVAASVQSTLAAAVTAPAAMASAMAVSPTTAPAMAPISSTSAATAHPVPVPLATAPAVSPIMPSPISPTMPAPASVPAQSTASTPSSQSGKPNLVSESISSVSHSKKESNSTIAVSHAATFTPIHSTISPTSYDRETLKIVLFGDSNIGDDLLDDVLSYAKFRQSLISKA